MSSQPRILVQAGATLDTLTDVTVNGAPHDVSSPLFEGHIGVRIDSWLGRSGDEPTSPTTPFHDGATLSIVIEGRFKEGVKASEVLWGNEWDKPIRDSLPYGTKAGLSFMYFIDPTLTQDIYADKPWALSPLLSTVNYLSIQKMNPDEPIPAFDYVVGEDLALANDPALKDHPDKRKKWLSDSRNHSSVILGPDTYVAADFCNGFIDLKTLSIKLPVGLSFSLQNLWDGQPVRFVCRNTDGSKKYFLVTFSIVDGEAAPPAPAAKEDVVAEDADTLGVD